MHVPDRSAAPRDGPDQSPAPRDGPTPVPRPPAPNRSAARHRSVHPTFACPPFFVPAPTLRDLFDARFALESTAVRWGMERTRPLDGVLHAFEEMKAEGTSTARLVDLDVEFHSALVDFSGSRFLLQAWLAIAPVIHTVITLGNRSLAEQDPEQNFTRIIDSHAVIVDALLRGEADEVVASLAKQFDFTQRVFRPDRLSRDGATR